MNTCPPNKRHAFVFANHTRACYHIGLIIQNGQNKVGDFTWVMLAIGIVVLVLAGIVILGLGGA